MLPDAVTIVAAGPRDGLAEREPGMVPTGTTIEFIDRLPATLAKRPA